MDLLNGLTSLFILFLPCLMKYFDMVHKFLLFLGKYFEADLKFVHHLAKIIDT